MKACRLAIIFALYGCALTPDLLDNQAMIAPNVTFVIPPPAAVGRSVSVTQNIVAHYGSHSFAFDGQLQITPAELDLVAVDGLGRRGLTVTWKAGAFDSKLAPWMPPLLRSADIVADIALVYWPKEALTSALSGATLTETATSRTVSAGGHDVIVIDYGNGTGWNRSATLRNVAFGYSIDIQSAEQ